MAISGWDVTLKDNKQIVLGEKGDESDYAYLGANHNFIIDNSNVELYGSALLAYEGDITDGVGKFEIKNSTLTFNDKSSLHMGEDGVPSKAPLIISGSKITMKNSSNISFQGENKEKTKITNSNIQMWNNSSMSLNDLSMEHSHILMKDSSELSLNNLTMEKSHIILMMLQHLMLKMLNLIRGLLLMVKTALIRRTRLNLVVMLIFLVSLTLPKQMLKAILLAVVMMTKSPII